MLDKVYLETLTQKPLILCICGPKETHFQYISQSSIRLGSVACKFSPGGHFQDFPLLMGIWQQLRFVDSPTFRKEYRNTVFLNHQQSETSTFLAWCRLVKQMVVTKFPLSFGLNMGYMGYKLKPASLEVFSRPKRRYSNSRCFHWWRVTRLPKHWSPWSNESCLLCDFWVRVYLPMSSRNSKISEKRPHQPPIS